MCLSEGEAGLPGRARDAYLLWTDSRGASAQAGGPRRSRRSPPGPSTSSGLHLPFVWARSCLDTKLSGHTRPDARSTQGAPRPVVRTPAFHSTAVERVRSPVRELRSRVPRGI